MTGVIVTGMHRSGTTLATRFLRAGGWHPGDVLLSSPTEEYLEDADLVAMHRAWLGVPTRSGAVSGGRPPDGDDPTSHRDWGLVQGAVVTPSAEDRAGRAHRSAQARRYVDTRAAGHRRWAAKDPRASLFLDEWSDIDDLVFVLVYRSPWDAVDSALRLPSPTFRRRPGLARTAWAEYNRNIVDLVTRHRSRCVLLSSESLALDPAGAWSALQRSIDLDGSAPVHLVDDRRLHRRSDQHPIASVYADLYPDLVGVLRELDDLADLPRPDSRPSTPDGTTTSDRPSARPLAGGALGPGVGIQVVIPCRDDGDFLAEAVASVDEHADGHVELTVVDDGSTDRETLRVLDALRSAGRHVVTTTGIGLAAARNAGCATSTSLAVIPLDADNRLRSSLFHAASLLGNGVDIVHGPWQCIDATSHVMHPPVMSLPTLLPHNCIDACALVRRDTLDALDGWNVRLSYWEDWDMWLRACRLGARSHRLDEPTHDYLVRPASLASGPRRDRRQRRRTLDIVLSPHRDLLSRRTIRRIRRAYWTHVWQPDRPIPRLLRRPAARHRRRLLQCIAEDLAHLEAHPSG